MPRKNNNDRLQHIVFTFNNYVEERDVPRLTELFEKEAKYYISVEKSVSDLLLTSRDTVHFQDGILSSMFAISSALGSISKGQKELLDKIEFIALRLEITSRVVHSLQDDLDKIKTNFPGSSSPWSEGEIRALLNSPEATPIFGSIMDLTCSETLWPSDPPSKGQI